MPNLSNAQQVQSTTNSCPVCDHTARRDEDLLDALQQARYILNAKDLIEDPRERVVRAKLAIEEALRLMQPLRW
ncbi:MAG: hypothetical protein H0X30_01260 [Anaerolineae bacterium]|nr:hypothetical protein [Anaerolineae bacterium]